RPRHSVETARLVRPEPPSPPAAPRRRAAPALRPARSAGSGGGPSSLPLLQNLGRLAQQLGQPTIDALPRLLLALPRRLPPRPSTPRGAGFLCLPGPSNQGPTLP